MKKWKAPEVVDLKGYLIEVIGDSKSIDFAAAELGVSYNTLVNWIKELFKTDDIFLFLNNFVCNRGCHLYECQGARWRVIKSLNGRKNLRINRSDFCIQRLGYNKICSSVEIQDLDKFKLKKMV